MRANQERTARSLHLYLSPAMGRTNAILQMRGGLQFPTSLPIVNKLHKEPSHEYASIFAVH
jgi:hypothetical protein